MLFEGPKSPANSSNEHEEINFVKEAFKLQYNWISLVGAGVFAVMSGSLLPILLATGLELMYLAIVPQNWRFQRLMRSWKLAEKLEQNQKQFAELLNALPSEARGRYMQLAQVSASVRRNFSQLSSTSQIFLQQMDARLDGLLRGYARLLLSFSQQQQYLKTTDQNDIKREVAALQRSMNSDSPKVQDINKKRIEILNKRLEKHQKIAENQDVVEAQCSAVEDVLHLVRDQSVTMRDPQQVSEQLENLVKDVEQTEQTVQQVEAVFGSMSSDLEGLMSVEDVSPSPVSRQRVKN
jgi:hypothetical protein